MTPGCPGDDEPFDSSRAPGFCDGDWPPWLQQEMGEVLPESVLRKCAKKVASCINGDYWEIEKRDVPAILKELEALGIRAVKAPKLSFH